MKMSLLMGASACLFSVISASANETSCDFILGDFKCTDVMSPNGFELSISTFEQNGAKGFLIAGSRKKIQFLLDGKEHVQENTSSILRNASGRCTEAGMNILEQVTNRSNGVQYKVAQTLQVHGKTGRFFQFDIETSQKNTSSSSWSSPAPEKFLCMRK